MPNFTFFRSPFANFYSPFYSNYNYYYNKKNNLYKKNNPNINCNNSDQKDHIHKNNIYNNKKSPKYNSSPFDLISDFISGNPKNDDAFFEIMGIKLYLDDIIILSLLFILYKEGIKDEMLFLALILLLLT